MGKKLETPLSPCFVLFVFKFFLLNSLSYLFVYSFVCLFVLEGQTAGEGYYVFFQMKKSYEDHLGAAVVLKVWSLTKCLNIAWEM